MKTVATLTCLTIALATLSAASEANAQGFRLGPFSAQLGSGRIQYTHPGSSHRYVTPHRPIIANPGQPKRIGLPNPWETPIYVQPKRLERLVFNPLTGQWQVKTTEEVINQSALDPNRGVVDPGSYRVTSSIGRDRYGNQVETRVESWTSYGVPHSNTTQRIIRRHGNVVVEEEKTVVRSANPGI